MATDAAYSEEVSAVRNAKRAIRRWAIGLVATAAVAIVLLYLLRAPAARAGSILDDNLFLLGTIVVIGAFLLASRVVQWKVLLQYDVHCTFCHRPLATRIRVLSSPSPMCPHCHMRIFEGHP